MDIGDVVRLGHGNTSSCRGRFRSGKVQSFQHCSRVWPESTDARGSNPCAGQACSHWDCRLGADLRFLILPLQHHVRVLPEEY